MSQSVTIRIPDEMFSYLSKYTQDSALSMTDVVLVLLKVGCENRRESVEELEQLRLLAVEERKYELSTSQLRFLMKKCYLVENFEKLAIRIRGNATMTKEQKRDIYNSMENRIVEIWGKDSVQHDAVKKWSDLNVPN